MELSEVCELIVDCEHKTAPTQESGYPSIRTPNIGRGRFILAGVNRVSEETYRLWTRRAVPQPGDLIMAREAPVGNVAMIPPRLQLCLGQRTLLIRPDRSKVEPSFLNYFLNGPHVQGLIQAKTNGATVAHLNMEDVRTMELPELPPLPVQKRIAGILSAYDELMENNQRRIRILEEMARTLYREWFVHFRFPAYEKIKWVDSTLGPIPLGWEVKNLGQITAYLNRGLSPAYDENGDSMVINQKCIRDRRLSLEPARRQTKPIPAEKRVRFGDVLINSTGVGTLGRVAQVYEDLGTSTVDTHVTIARPESETDVDFFGCSLLGLQATFDRLGIGATGQTELGRTAIAGVELVCPPTLIQRRFGEIVRPMRSAATVLQNQIGMLRRTRDLLLPRLLSGQVNLEII